MPKQPTRKAKKKSKASNAKPLSWVPLTVYLKREEQQTGSMPRAIKVLEKELESGKRRIERENIKTLKREPVAASCWAGHLIDIGTGEPAIYRCKPGDKDDPQRWGFYAHHHDDLVSNGYVYFVGADRVSPSAPVRRKSRADREPLLFSLQKAEEAKQFYHGKLDETAQAKPPLLKKEDDPKYWRNQRTAATHIAVKVLGLKAESWQSVKTWVVKPVLSEWKAAQQPKKITQKK